LRALARPTSIRERAPARPPRYFDELPNKENRRVREVGREMAKLARTAGFA